MNDRFPTDQLLAYLQGLGFRLNDEYMREALRALMQLLIELEVSAAIEANPYERKQDRLAYRNGYRERSWQTEYGEIRLRIPKLRRGTYYPSLIESLEQTEQALLALIQDAFVLGTNPEAVEDSLDNLGFPTLHRSDVWEFYESLHDIAENARNYPLKAEYPYLWLDVVKLKVSEGNLRTSKAVAVAIGVKSTGEYEVLALETTNHVEDEAFWRRFLHNLEARGLRDVRLIISDSYDGVRQAAGDVFPAARWQYSRAYTLRDILKHVPQVDQPKVVVAISTLFVQQTHDTAMLQLTRLTRNLQAQWPDAASALRLSGQKMLSYLDFSSRDDDAAASALILLRLKQALENQADAIGISYDEAASEVSNSNLITLEPEAKIFELYGEMTPNIVMQSLPMAG
jgi:transposase-like protein